MIGIGPGLARDLVRIVPLHSVSFEVPWTHEAFESLMTSPGVLLLKAFDEAASDPEDDLKGFVLVRIVADEAEILSIAVDPQHYGKRIGEQLMQTAAAHALGLGAMSLFLEVAEDNASARRLYERLGFETVGRRPDYYTRGKGRIAGLSMRLDLPKTLILKRL
tara:strand:+ start:135833 stop:136321 length:489 start_codon:yes stop_codon:yes gene_type:complete